MKSRRGHERRGSLLSEQLRRPPRFFEAASVSRLFRVFRGYLGFHSLAALPRWAFTLGLAVLFGLAAQLRAQQPADEESRSRFCAVDIFVDSGSTPLAAYQLRFAVTNGTAKIVGIEGGEHPAFRQPPFYDPKAIQNDVAIIASFNTGPVGELPKGKTRVATIHLQTTGTGRLHYELKMQAAAGTQGAKISCLASFEERNSE